MALSLRKGSDAVVLALATALTALRADATILGSRFHADVTAITGGDFTTPTATALTVTAPNASSLATSIVLANQIRAYLNAQVADAVAHKAADAANVVTAPVATDLTSVQTLANAEKTAFNAHLTQSGVHYTNDATNTVATANATDQTTANALLNALKSAINAHVVSAPAGFAVVLVSA